MTIKYFCSMCGKPCDPTKHNSFNRIHRKKGRITVEVMVAIDNTWNGGEVCKTCVLDTVAKGKDIKP